MNEIVSGSLKAQGRNVTLKDMQRPQVCRKVLVFIETAIGSDRGDFKPRTA